MGAGLPDIVAEKLLGLWSSLFPGMLAMIAACTVISLFSSQACNPGKMWWRNRGLAVDVCYWLMVQGLAPYFRMGLLILIATLAMPFASVAQVDDYIENGRGPVSLLSFWGQAGFYLLASDFLLYWIHRLFHGASMWRYHAIHHSAEDVDWTTAYRFHPVNLCFGPYLADVIMLYLGVAPGVLLFLVPLQTTTSLFVHANLNWTFGPLKYVLATPVFHRWHHTAADEGGNRNFASTFALWDVLFGTFYMPLGRLPARYGVDDPQFPSGFLAQLIFPLLRRARTSRLGGALSGPPSALESGQPQRQS
jgi:sterol desaturase/sphingolipid hydroxylase (fatty acid hydroxylase superfamily)